MELDDLKQAWQQQTPEDIDVRNNKNIIDMIQNKSYGPLASLKSRFSKTMIIFPLTILILIYDIIEKPQLLHDSLMRFFLGFILYIFAYSFYFYKMINTMQNVNGALRSDMENNINTFENSYKKFQIINRIVLIILFGLIEILMHYHKEPDYESWYKVSIYLRVCVYIGIIAITGFTYTFAYKKQFGKHIDYMKDMLRKME